MWSVDSLLSAAVVHASLIGAVTYLAKVIVAQVMSRDIEQYKSGLSTALEAQRGALARELESHKTKLMMDVEAYKRQLEAADFEHRKALTMLVEKRAAVIEEMQSRVMEARRRVQDMAALGRFVTGDKAIDEAAEQERVKTAIDAYNGLLEQVDKCDIYFSDDTAERLHNLVTLLRTTVFDYQLAKNKQFSGVDQTKRWVDADGRMTKEVPPVLAALKSDFRRLLAVTRPTTT